MVDVTKLKANVTVRLADGSLGVIRGSYMSVAGIVLRVKTEAGSPVDRNVPLSDVMEVIDA